MNNLLLLSALLTSLVLGSAQLRVAVEAPVSEASVTVSVLRTGEVLSTGSVSQGPGGFIGKQAFDQLSTDDRAEALGRVTLPGFEAFPDVPLLVTAEGGLEAPQSDSGEAETRVVAGKWHAVVSREQLATDSVTVGLATDVIYLSLISEFPGLSEGEVWSALEQRTVELFPEAELDYAQLLAGEHAVVVSERLRDYAALVRAGFTPQQRFDALGDTLFSSLLAAPTSGDGDASVDADTIGEILPGSDVGESGAQDELRERFDSDIVPIVESVCLSCHLYATAARLWPASPMDMDANFFDFTQPWFARQISQFCNGGHRGGRFVPGVLLTAEQCTSLNQFGDQVLEQQQAAPE